jgi:hypothetical protein
LLIATLAIVAFASIALVRAQSVVTPAAYLPLIQRDLVPTAAPTFTPVPFHPVINGGFEQGDEGWEAFNFPSPLPPVILYGPSSAHTGKGYAAFRGSATGAGIGVELMQHMTVPAATPYLVYWSAVFSQGTDCNIDIAFVQSQILHITLDNVEEFCAAQQHGYRKRVIDLRQFVGITVDVSFAWHTSSGVFNEWDIDDVHFEATP